MLASVRARWYVAGGITAGVLVLVLLLWLLPGRSEPPRERRYRDVTACLLTDSHGLVGEPAATVWAGMQDASLETLAKVQYLSVTGEQTKQNATLFLNSLGQGGCAIVVAVGDAPTQAALTGAVTFPQVRFVLVGAQGSGAPNVSSVEVSESKAMRAAVKDVVTTLVGSSPAS